MKKNILVLLFTLTVVLISGLEVNAQTVGKIFSKAVADSLYGPVLNSVKISTDSLQKTAALTKNGIMFNIIGNDSLIILGDNRVALSQKGLTVPDSVVFKYYSVSVLEKLLKEGGSKETYIEKRKKVLTVTNGVYTMEEARPCPPFCH